MNKKVLRIGVLVVILAALFAVVGSALAATPPPEPTCGKAIRIGSNGLKVVKGVDCEVDRSWNWVIEKIADYSSLILSVGQSHLVNYQVTASASVSDATFGLHGRITITNPTAQPITITSVSDSLPSVTVTCPFTLPYVIPANWTVECNYSGSTDTQPDTNVASVVDSNGVEVSTSVNIDWSKAIVTEADECAVVTDTYAGTLGNICAGQQTTFTFDYTRQIGPYDVCGDYTVDNTASFTTNDTGATGSSSWTVDVTVPCEGGCTLTPGYWKTHSTYGPAPYDDTWAQIGEDTVFFFSGKSYYQALWASPQGNAYWILAHAYIAAELNQLNGADFTAAQAAFDQATALFNNPTNTPAYVGGLNGTARQTWINLATTLDNYNNGLTGPGHCSE